MRSARIRHQSATVIVLVLLIVGLVGHTAHAFYDAMSAVTSDRAARSTLTP